MRGVPIMRVGDTLLVDVQVDLRDSIAEAFQEDLLKRIEETGALGLIVDVTALDMVDSYVARVLVETSRMARLMGTETVIVGVQPVVAATLTRMGFPLEGLLTALDVDDGLRLLAERARPGLLRRRRR
jgi:rsbT antagonist protein RsbS